MSGLAGILGVSATEFQIPSQPDIVRIYIAILLGILLLAGLILAILDLGFRRNVRVIWPTYASWWALGPITFAAIFFGRMPTILLFVLLSILSFREFARASGVDRDIWITLAGYLAIGLAGISCLIRDPHSGAFGWHGLFMAMPAFSVALFMFISILRNCAEGQLQNIAMANLGFILIGWMFLHLGLLADSPNFAGYLMFLLLAVELNDVAAFIFGRLLGQNRKHPLRSNISPKKTWEGACGALAVSMALPWFLRFSFPYFGCQQLILTGLIVGIGGPLGDLSVSLIKRELGRKDMGAMIPGHGGVLDRIDSLILTAPLFQYMVKFYYGH